MSKHKFIYQDLLHPPLMALALLTRLPITAFLPPQWSLRHQGLSVLWYPFVGVILALLLLAFYRLLPVGVSPLVSAMLLTFVWVFLTGALHLDGLADSVDAAFSAHAVQGSTSFSDASRESVLAVFKDPAAGPMAVIALVFVLLAKVLLLAELLVQHHLSNLLIVMLVLVLPRVAALSLIISTPYVRPKGLGAVLSAYAPVRLSLVIISLIVVAVFVLVPVGVAVSLLLAVGLLVFYWRRFWLCRIHGIVGDCIGALIELCEVLMLFIIYCAVLCFYSP